MQDSALTSIVCTAIYGGYDRLRVLRYRDPAFRYVAFTDGPNFKNGWEVYEDIPGCPRDLTSKMQAKYAKVNIYDVFPSADWTVWTDGNVRPNIVNLIQFALSHGDADMYFFKHPERDCAYQEGHVCATRGLDNSDVINAQIARYQSEGFPRNHGLWCGCFFMRRNTPRVRKFNSVWWKEIQRGSCRDQISLPYVLWKLGIEPVELGTTYRQDGKIDVFSHCKYALPNCTEGSAQSRPIQKKALHLWDEEPPAVAKKERTRGTGQTAWYNLMASFIREGDRVLDSGCGLGLCHADLYAQRPALLVGADIDEKVLAEVDILGPNHQVCRCDQIPLARFDAVLSIDVIEHVEDDLVYLREIKDRTGRVLIISTPNLKKGRCRSPYHCREYSPIQFETLIRKVFSDCSLLFGALPGPEVASRNFHSLFLNTTYWEHTISGDVLLAIVFR